MLISYGAYLLEQDESEPGVWISQEGKRFAHILLDKPLSERELRSQMDELMPIIHRTLLTDKAKIKKV